MKGTLKWVLGVALLCTACAGYQARKQAAQTEWPPLGAAVKQEGGWLYEAAREVGHPITRPVRVTARSIPFSAGSYNAYSQALKRQGLRPSIPYADTLNIAPKYLRLALADLPDMTTLLNSEPNTDFRAYLAASPAYGLVTGVDAALPEADMAYILQAEGLFLEQNPLGGLQLRVVGDQEERMYGARDLSVFHLEVASLCWAQDHRGRPVVAQLAADGYRCPKGTEKDAAKWDKKDVFERF